MLLHGKSDTKKGGAHHTHHHRVHPASTGIIMRKKESLPCYPDWAPSHVIFTHAAYDHVF